MLTKVFKIEITPEDKVVIHQNQLDYSCAFRKIYNNLDLIVDKSFKEEIRSKHNLSAKMYEYIVNEAETWLKKRETRYNKLEETVVKLYKKLNDKSAKKLKKHKRSSINTKIQRLTTSMKKDYTFGSIKLARELTKNPDDKDLRIKWKEARTYMMLMQGETSSKGARFFDFSELQEGIIYYKPNRNTKIRLTLNLGNKSYKTLNLLKNLQEMALNKEMPLAIGLSTNELHLTYDETILYDTKFDKKSVYKEIKELNLTGEESKQHLRGAHKEHEFKLFKGKMKNRYCALDLNPDGIGLVITERLSECKKGDFKIIYKEFIDFSGLNVKLKLLSKDIRQKKQNHKRKYELSIAVKHIFKLIKHYKVAHFITEDLNFKKSSNDLGNKTANRKVNNMWCRTLLTELFTKYTNTCGLKWTEINPVYSSFIGNLINTDYDPVSAAIEIARRGMTKFIKESSIFPEFYIPWTSSDLEKLKLSKKMNEKLNDCKTWKELYDWVSHTEMSVRRTLDESNVSVNYLDSTKSGVKLYEMDVNV